MDDLLGGLSEDERRLVTAKMTRRAFKKGDTLFFEGDPGDNLTGVLKGGGGANDHAAG